MSPLAEQEQLRLARCDDLFPPGTLLDGLGKIGAVNFFILFVAAVVAFAVYLFRTSR